MLDLLFFDLLYIILMELFRRYIIMRKISLILCVLLTAAIALSCVAMASESSLGTADEHVHEWDYQQRRCVECREQHPCWDEDEMTYVHDFSTSDVCKTCGTNRYCGCVDHEKDEDHEIASCGVPGHYACDELDHDVYPFDVDKHTQCLDAVEHVCDDCDRTYACDRSNSHCRCIKCGRPWCDKSKGNHTEADCGHRYCEIYGEEEDHDKCEGCGKYLCNGKDHSDCIVEEPTPEPTVEPTVEPTAEPTAEPTVEPTAEPSSEPTEEPTSGPDSEVSPSPDAGDDSKAE